MFIVEMFKGIFFSGGPIGTTNKDQAAMFTSKESAQKYSKDMSGSKVIEKKRKK